MKRIVILIIRLFMNSNSVIRKFLYVNSALAGIPGRHAGKGVLQSQRGARERASRNPNAGRGQGRNESYKIHSGIKISAMYYS